MKQPFYLTKRKLPSGNHVWYYYYYDIHNQRTVPKSTGCHKKGDAMTFCAELFRTQSFLDRRRKMKDFSEGFFDEGSAWYEDKKLAQRENTSTTISYKQCLENYILPYFENMYLDRIQPCDVKNFRIWMSEKKGLSNKTINNTVSVLRILFDSAVEEGLLYRTPITKSIQPLKVESKREAFTKEEVLAMLGNRLPNNKQWLFFATAAITGMRFSEIVGLQPHQIKDGYINVSQQFIHGKVVPPKQGSERFVTIPKKLKTALIKLCDGGEFVFHGQQKSTPLSPTTIKKSLYKIYTKEINETKESRGLAFHSFRHFFNTLLASNRIEDVRINYLTGHSAGKQNQMFMRYTSWTAEMFEDVLHIQEELFDSLIAVKNLSEKSRMT